MSDVIPHKIVYNLNLKDTFDSVENSYTLSYILGNVVLFVTVRDVSEENPIKY